MSATNREQIRARRRALADAHAAVIRLYEETIALLCEEFKLDAVDFWNSEREQRSRSSRIPANARATNSSGRPIIDRTLLTVSFAGKSCFLGNSLPFRLLACLLEHPNRFVSYDDLLTEVWMGSRSRDAVRSVMKVLRSKLRIAGMESLASAIHGSVRGHYSIRLAKQR